MFQGDQSRKGKSLDLLHERSSSFNSDVHEGKILRVRTKNVKSVCNLRVQINGVYQSIEDASCPEGRLTDFGSWNRWKDKRPWSEFRIPVISSRGTWRTDSEAALSSLAAEGEGQPGIL
jgi:hypothetical protein